MVCCGATLCLRVRWRLGAKTEGGDRTAGVLGYAVRGTVGAGVGRVRLSRSRSVALVASLALALAGACGGTDAGNIRWNFPAREAVIRSRGVIAHLRLDAPAPEATTVLGGMTVGYVPWRMTVLGQLSAVSPENAMATSGTFVQEVWIAAEDGSHVPVAWDGSAPFRPPVREGAEFLVVCTVCDAQFFHEGRRNELYPVAPSTHALAAPALGFPAGTPVATVLDASTLR